MKTLHYCLVICRVSSTGHIDRSMIRGKLLDNDTQLFIFISDPENRQQNRFSERRFSKKYSYNRLNGKAWLGLLPVRIYREIMPSSCPLT